MNKIGLDLNIVHPKSPKLIENPNPINVDVALQEGVDALKQLLSKGLTESARGPLTVEGAVVIRGGSQPLVEHNPDVHLRKDIRMCKALSAVVATDFRIGDEGEVDGADRLESRSLEAANRFQVLEADAFHVLGAPGVDVTGGAIDLGAKRWVRPLVRLGRDDVGVGIEEDSGEGGILARPLEDNHRLPLHEFYNLSFQG
nr:peptidyl-tRNA hydrolase, mitochondrial-like [Ipomoea batatas]